MFKCCCKNKTEQFFDCVPAPLEGDCFHPTTDRIEQININVTAPDNSGSCWQDQDLEDGGDLNTWMGCNQSCDVDKVNTMTFDSYDKTFVYRPTGNNAVFTSDCTFGTFPSTGKECHESVTMRTASNCVGSADISIWQQHGAFEVCCDPRCTHCTGSVAAERRTFRLSLQISNYLSISVASYWQGMGFSSISPGSGTPQFGSQARVNSGWTQYYSNIHSDDCLKPAAAAKIYNGNTMTQMPNHYSNWCRLPTNNDWTRANNQPDEQAPKRGDLYHVPLGFNRNNSVHQSNCFLLNFGGQIRVADLFDVEFEFIDKNGNVL